MAFLAMRKLTGWLDKCQLWHYMVLSQLLEYLNVWQEKQLGPGRRINIIIPGEICQAIDMASYL
jgi:hypothetical protein